MSIGNTIYRFTEKISRRLPHPMIATYGMAVNYLGSSRDVFAFENTRMINTAFGYAMNCKIPGDYAEFGVYQAKTSIEAFWASKRTGFGDMKFYLFDSFEGLPEIAEIDKGEFHKGEFYCSKDNVIGNLKGAGCDFSRFELVEGFFDVSLPKFAAQPKFSVVFIDCDLYESTVPVLDFLTTRIQNGTVIIFDDWHHFYSNPEKGQQLATREWLDRNPNIKLRPFRGYHFAGESFIVNL